MKRKVKLLTCGDKKTLTRNFFLFFLKINKGERKLKLWKIEFKNAKKF